MNSTQGTTSTTPDGLLEPATYYGYSPEDVDQNGFLDNWGGKNIGYGFGVNTNTVRRIPTSPPPGCNTTGLTNAVSGARHVLKLVAGGMSAAGRQLSAYPAARGRMHIHRDHRLRRVHGGIGESGLRSGRLQHRRRGSLLERRQQQHPALGGIDCRRLGHAAVEH